MDGKHTGLCAICGDENKEIPITEFFCNDCKIVYAEPIQMNAIWVQMQKEHETIMRNITRREHARVEALDPDTDIAEGESTRPIEDLVPAQGTMEQFIEFETTRQFFDVWMALSNHHVKGFDVYDFETAQEALAVLIYMMAETKIYYDLIDDDNSKKAAWNAFCNASAKYGLKPITNKWYQDLRRAGLYKIRTYRKTGRIDPKWIVRPSKD